MGACFSYYSPARRAAIDWAPPTQFASRPSAKHPHTHMHTATWPFSTLRPVSGSCYANREEGMEGGRDEEERQSSQPIVKGQREGEQGDWPRSTISIAMPEQQQTSCYTKGVLPPSTPLPSPLCSPLSHLNPFYTPVVKGAVSAVCKVTLLLPCGRNHSTLKTERTASVCACVCAWESVCPFPCFV